MPVDELLHKIWARMVNWVLDMWHEVSLKKVKGRRHARHNVFWISLEMEIGP
jgi:hypothetical protein